MSRSVSAFFSALILAAALVPSTVLASAATATTTVPTIRISATAGPCATARAELLRRTNARRRIHGLRPLTFDSRLNVAAQRHSVYMAKAARMSHDNWIAEIRASGYPAGGYWSQNVAVGQVNAAIVMNMWMHSPHHKDNLLSARFRHLGVGCARRGTTGNGYYWTANFAG